jgi:hypothetical protein
MPVLAPAPKITDGEQAAALALYCSPFHNSDELTIEQVTEAINTVMAAIGGAS